ncbi:hypothetical protein FZEAL_8314 [Fusarium zealandicum]|uniref:Cell wall protein n=1 Tax=Fusarium zealandicum TaxID=1053134 RepID=A0A8H4UEG4_9HYPO|nr:hypothetical protein FZEAL_8314 [Fusarium zealandicum]
MRFAGSLIVGLLVGRGLCQNPDAPVDEEATLVSPPEATAITPEEPSIVPDDPLPESEEVPVATADPEESAPAPEEPSAPTEAPDDEPTAVDTVVEATATDNDEVSEPTTEAEETGAEEDATATDDVSSLPEATATDDSETEDATATATATETSTESPTSTSEPVVVDLSNATVGDNAEMIEVEGKPAIRLNAPANGEATFTVSVETTDDLDTDELVRLVASILVGEGSDSAKLRRRAAETDCSLRMIVDNKKVYDEPLMSTGGQFQDVSGTGVALSEKPDVQVTQSCRSQPASLTVRDVSLQAGPRQAGGSGGTGSGSGSAGGSGTGTSSGGKGSGGSDSDSGTETGDESQSSETGNPSMGSKATTSIMGLVIALVAVGVFI